MDLSVVMPCLNEVETLGTCISKCINSFERMGINAEIIIADNGSQDGSLELAKSKGARVVTVAEKGYGKALIGGIKEAKGKYIIMGDADDSYDFNKIDEFYQKLVTGYDIVQGCRFSIGGGKIEDKAMPLTHKYIGNPLFSTISKFFFSLPFNDVYCGYRGFNKEKFLELNHFSGGMVFAIENLIKFKVSGAKCGEIPVTLHKDGRKKNKSHLNTISDGWKTLRFLVLTCPKWLYFFPALILLLTSFINLFEFFSIDQGYKSYNSIKQLITSQIFFLLSFQIFMFGLFSSLFAQKLKLLRSKTINIFFKIFKLRYAFFISFILICALISINFFNNNINLDLVYLNIINYFIIFFSVLLILNSLYVSLITLDETS